MISEKEFRNAVYAIDIGQNDINLALVANSSYQLVVDKIPIILERIDNSTKVSFHMFVTVDILPAHIDWCV